MDRDHGQGPHQHPPLGGQDVLTSDLGQLNVLSAALVLHYVAPSILRRGTKYLGMRMACCYSGDEIRTEVMLRGGRVYHTATSLRCSTGIISRMERSYALP